MNIAYTMAPARGHTDLLLFNFARSVLERGLRPVGIVQINTERDAASPCDMDVQVLPDGPVIRISQSLGHLSKGCRLDPSALEQAVGLVEARLVEGADCLIINKFGRLEAEGHGFRSVIADALARNIPVLVGLNRLNADAFLAFSDGLAVQLPPSESDLLEWLSMITMFGSEIA
jgi:hypothetical protein